MFTQTTQTLSARRKEAMDTILERATRIVAQDVANGDLTREEAVKVHVFAIAALASGMPGASVEKGAADSRREVVRDYLDSLLSDEVEEEDAA